MKKRINNYLINMDLILNLCKIKYINFMKDILVNPIFIAIWIYNI